MAIRSHPDTSTTPAKTDMVKRLNLRPEAFFLTRKATVEKFSRIEEWGRMFPIFGTPVYLEFLGGRRELSCSAWAIPTRNIRGWKAPCYLMTDGHYGSYRELLEKTDWSRYGVVNGEARDPRCENCMMHCGYEPTASLGLEAQPGDLWKTIKFNFGARPKPFSADGVAAYNGVTVGNGHLTGKTPGSAASRSELNEGQCTALPAPLPLQSLPRVSKRPSPKRNRISSGCSTTTATGAAS